MVSPKYSQVPLPNAVMPADSQKLRPLRAPGVEVVVALIRVADLVDAEVVQVPHPALLHVGPPRLRRHLRRDLAAHEIGEPVDDVDERGVQEGAADASPGTAVARASLRGPRRRIGANGTLAGRVDSAAEVDEERVTCGPFNQLRGAGAACSGESASAVCAFAEPAVAMTARTRNTRACSNAEAL